MPLRKVAIHSAVAAPAHWEPMNQTPMPIGLDDGEMLAAMAERIELFHPIDR